MSVSVKMSPPKRTEAEDPIKILPKMPLTQRDRSVRNEERKLLERLDPSLKEKRLRERKQRRQRKLWNTFLEKLAKQREDEQVEIRNAYSWHAGTQDVVTSRNGAHLKLSEVVRNNQHPNVSTPETL